MSGINVKTSNTLGVFGAFQQLVANPELQGEVKEIEKRGEIASVQTVKNSSGRVTELKCAGYKIEPGKVGATLPNAYSLRKSLMDAVNDELNIISGKLMLELEDKSARETLDKLVTDLSKSCESLIFNPSTQNLSNDKLKKIVGSMGDLLEGLKKITVDDLASSTKESLHDRICATTAKNMIPIKRETVGLGDVEGWQADLAGKQMRKMEEAWSREHGFPSGQKLPPLDRYVCLDELLRDPEYKACSEVVKAEFEAQMKELAEVAVPQAKKRLEEIETTWQNSFDQKVSKIKESGKQGRDLYVVIEKEYANRIREFLANPEYVKCAGVARGDSEFEPVVPKPQVDSVADSQEQKLSKCPFEVIKGGTAEVAKQLKELYPDDETAIQVFGDGTFWGGTISSAGQEEGTVRSCNPRNVAALAYQGLVKLNGTQVEYVLGADKFVKLPTVEGYLYKTKIDSANYIGSGKPVDVTQLVSSSPTFACVSRVNTDLVGDVTWLWKCRQMLGMAPGRTEQVSTATAQRMSRECANVSDFISRIWDIQFSDSKKPSHVYPDGDLKFCKGLKAKAGLNKTGLDGTKIWGPNTKDKADQKPPLVVTRYQDMMMCVLFAADKLRSQYGVDVFADSMELQNNINKLLELFKSGKYRALLDEAKANYEAVLTQQVDQWVAALKDRGVKRVVSGAAGCGWFLNDDRVMSKIYAKAFVKHGIEFVYANFGGAKDPHVDIWKDAFQNAWNEKLDPEDRNSPDEVSPDEASPAQMTDVSEKRIFTDYSLDELGAKTSTEYQYRNPNKNPEHLYMLNENRISEVVSRDCKGKDFRYACAVTLQMVSERTYELSVTTTEKKQAYLDVLKELKRLIESADVSETGTWNLWNKCKELVWSRGEELGEVLAHQLEDALWVAHQNFEGSIKADYKLEDLGAKTGVDYQYNHPKKGTVLNENRLNDAIVNAISGRKKDETKTFTAVCAVALDMVSEKAPQFAEMDPKTKKAYLTELKALKQILEKPSSEDLKAGTWPLWKECQRHIWKQYKALGPRMAQQLEDALWVAHEFYDADVLGLSKMKYGDASDRLDMPVVESKKPHKNKKVAVALKTDYSTKSLGKQKSGLYNKDHEPSVAFTNDIIKKCKGMDFRDAFRYALNLNSQESPVLYHASDRAKQAYRDFLGQVESVIEENNYSTAWELYEELDVMDLRLTLVGEYGLDHQVTHSPFQEDIYDVFWSACRAIGKDGKVKSTPLEVKSK